MPRVDKRKSQSRKYHHVPNVQFMLQPTWLKGWNPIGHKMVVVQVVHTRHHVARDEASWYALLVCKKLKGARKQLHVSQRLACELVSSFAEA